LTEVQSLRLIFLLTQGGRFVNDAISYILVK
jgi:hypothetical protein